MKARGSTHLRVSRRAYSKNYYLLLLSKVVIIATTQIMISLAEFDI